MMFKILEKSPANPYFWFSFFVLAGGGGPAYGLLARRCRRFFLFRANSGLLQRWQESS